VAHAVLRMWTYQGPQFPKWLSFKEGQKVLQFFLATWPGRE